MTYTETFVIRGAIKQLVDEWIQNNSEAIAHICDVSLSYSTQELKDQREDLINFVQKELIDKVSSVADDPRLTQRPLSERLANAGLLPMFGFPTRVRYLVHNKPKGGYHWPPEDVVDRDLDIAISQFAPCSETVKDGVIYTSIGVADYKPQGNSVVEQSDPLGPAIQIGMCRRCKAVDSSQTIRPTCPVCGAGAPDYEGINLSQPKGFRTWYDESRDFDGVFEGTCGGATDLYECV